MREREKEREQQEEDGASACTLASSTYWPACHARATRRKKTRTGICATRTFQFLARFSVSSDLSHAGAHFWVACIIHIDKRPTKRHRAAEHAVNAQFVDTSSGRLRPHTMNDARPDNCTRRVTYSFPRTPCSGGGNNNELLTILTLFPPSAHDGGKSVFPTNYLNTLTLYILQSKRGWKRAYREVSGLGRSQTYTHRVYTQRGAGTHSLHGKASVFQMASSTDAPFGRS